MEHDLQPPNNLLAQNHFIESSLNGIDPLQFIKTLNCKPNLLTDAEKELLNLDKKRKDLKQAFWIIESAYQAQNKTLKASEAMLKRQIKNHKERLELESKMTEEDLKRQAEEQVLKAHQKEVSLKLKIKRKSNIKIPPKDYDIHVCPNMDKKVPESWLELSPKELKEKREAFYTLWKSMKYNSRRFMYFDNTKYKLLISEEALYDALKDKTQFDTNLSTKKKLQTQT